MSSGKRHFVVAASEVGFNGGLYKSKSPISAAKKAAKVLLRMIENKDHNPEWHKFDHFKGKTVKFILRESTQGSAKKSYFYEASLVHLKEPKIIQRDGKDIAITKQVIVKTCNDHIGDAVSAFKSSQR